MSVAADASTAAVIIVGSAQFRRQVTRDPGLEARIIVSLAPHEALERDTSTAGHDVIIESAAFEHFELHAPEKLHAARTVVVPPPDERERLEEASPLSDAAQRFKRAFDVVVGGSLLLCLLPVLAALCLAVKLTSPGPALFSQVRVGQNGRTFRLFKLRSMRPHGDESEHRAYSASLIRGEARPVDGIFKLRHDPRITPLGKWLRERSLDELPQLWNVVRGDMSLVGPRPALPEEVALYGPRARQRLRVKPGMTGLWQVSGRSALDFDQMVDLDVCYWLDWSLRRELSIVLRTPLVVLTGRGAV